MTERPAPVNRRTFLRGLGVAAGAAVAVSCTSTPDAAVTDARDNIDAEQFPPTPPSTPPPPGILRFFTADEARTVSAFVGRLLPGTFNDPGALEAGVPTYIDNKLAEFEAFAEPTYQKGPFAESYEGAAPPALGPDKVAVEKSEADRYGFQSSLTPHEIYRTGLESLGAFCTSTRGAAFADLPAQDQDAVISALESGDAPGFDSPSAKLLFKTLHQDTVEGMFADPSYGGNRDLAGWQLIGYPGAQRSYSPVELKLGTKRPYQDLLRLAPTHPGVHSHAGAMVPTREPMHGVHHG